ncbi:hypothetical protein PQX77_006150 [Marasmius sp. AFHP31]|nr:hypothetical protein PQX77_006150 [Marasmius sp. AFHP31]
MERSDLQNGLEAALKEVHQWTHEGKKPRKGIVSVVSAFAIRSTLEWAVVAESSVLLQDPTGFQWTELVGKCMGPRHTPTLPALDTSVKPLHAHLTPTTLHSKHLYAPNSKVALPKQAVMKEISYAITVNAGQTNGLRGGEGTPSFVSTPAAFTCLVGTIAFNYAVSFVRARGNIVIRDTFKGAAGRKKCSHRSYKMERFEDTVESSGEERGDMGPLETTNIFSRDRGPRKLPSGMTNARMSQYSRQPSGYNGVRHLVVASGGCAEFNGRILALLPVGGRGWDLRILQPLPTSDTHFRQKLGRKYLPRGLLPMLRGVECGV